MTTRLITLCVQALSIHQVQIVTQPSTGPGPALVGNFIPGQPVLRVVDSSGAGVPGVSLTAFFVNDDCSPAPAMLDIANPLSIGLNNVYGLPISPPTNASGHTSYNSIVFMDALTGCYRLMFVAVVTTAPQMAIKHALSTPICVVNVDILAVDSQPAKVTSAGAPLSQPLTVTLTRPYRSDLVDVSCSSPHPPPTPPPHPPASPSAVRTQSHNHPSIPPRVSSPFPMFSRLCVSCGGLQYKIMALLALVDTYKFGARADDTKATLGLSGGDSAVSIAATPKFVISNVGRLHLVCN